MIRMVWSISPPPPTPPRYISLLLSFFFPSVFYSNNYKYKREPLSHSLWVSLGPSLTPERVSLFHALLNCGSRDHDFSFLGSGALFSKWTFWCISSLSPVRYWKANYSHITQSGNHLLIWPLHKPLLNLRDRNLVSKAKNKEKERWIDIKWEVWLVLNTNEDRPARKTMRLGIHSLITGSVKSFLHFLVVTFSKDKTPLRAES